jgi:tellurite resistance protein TerC
VVSALPPLFLPSVGGAEPVGQAGTIGTPVTWMVTVAGVAALLLVDVLVTRRPHAVSMREATAWSVLYIAVPVAFGGWVWTSHGPDRGLEYATGYLVEKSLSVDNLFIFLLLMTAFAVPRELQQRVLLIGVAGALVLRGVFIALGAQLIATFSWTFLLFGVVLLGTAAKLLRDARSGGAHVPDIRSLRSVRVVRRLWPVTEEYAGTRLTVRIRGRRALTPLALVVIAILATDIVFAVDSVPAVYGITGDPYLVFTTNAFALLGLRALYFVLAGALGSLVHLGYGLAAILGVIGVKLVLHWAHGVWPSVPEVPTLASLAAVLGILATVTVTSLVARRRPEASASDPVPSDVTRDPTSTAR